MCIRDRSYGRSSSSATHHLVRHLNGRVSEGAMPHTTCQHGRQVADTQLAMARERSAFAECAARAQLNRDRVVEANAEYYKFRPLPEHKLAHRDTSMRYEASPVNEANQLMRKYFESPNPSFGMHEGLRPDGRRVGEVALAHEHALELSRRRTAAYYPVL
eukprot:TRINITY_DN19401_c0_g1_i1.p1 TRINITY_DN19401_c0_g1~~TRINITY_DN19401_c0_g1_i1.p1  ORF type:complete len:160 (-),score=23.59 TRINITY_DN19401_c0_g1_i1:296-775(-)